MLDLFFRKYAWTANLLILFLGAWFTARMVNTLVGARIRPRPQADLSAPVSAPPRPVQVVELDDAKLYHLIGTEPPPVVQAESAAAPPPVMPQNCNDPAAEPRKSDLRLSLVVGVLAEVPRNSLATIADLNTRETKVVGVGEPIGSATFLGLRRMRAADDITRNAFRLQAVVCNGGTKEFVESEAGGPDNAGGTPMMPPPNIGTAPVPQPMNAMAGVRTVAPNRYEIDRSVIDSTLSDMSKIAMDARIVPSFKNGVANGFKLFSIRPGSLYSAIGIENGDVIQRINGYEINSPEKALELYQKLRESSNVKLDIEHNGQPLQKEYSITAGR
jgi:general secretion pathway protein C